MRGPILVLTVILLLLTSCSSPPPTIQYGIFTEEDIVGSVRQVTSCFHGPDPRFGIAADLDQNSQITIIGASIGGEYAVILNPSHSSKLCWVKHGEIDIHSADLRRAFEMVSIIHPESDDEDMDSEDLLAAFMRLNVTDPDSDSGTPFFEKVPMILDCPQQKEPEGDKPGKATAAAATAKAAEDDAQAQALHEGCSNLFLPGMCHSSQTIDRMNTECGELVYPVFYFPIENCTGLSGCATSTPPPVVFISCTPVPPLPTPVILNLTVCWNGPGEGYEAISSIEENTFVEVLGVGVDGNYIVITNPRYNRPCWVNEIDIELFDLDLAGLPIYGIPEQDAMDEDNALGCWVKEGRSDPKKCVAPCPDPKAYPEKCEPEN